MTEKIDLTRLVKALQNQEAIIEVEKSDYLDFINGNDAFLVLDGEVVAFDEVDASTRLRKTITLRKDDPIGVAEAIASRIPALRYAANTDVKLLKIDARS